MLSRVIRGKTPGIRSFGAMDLLKPELFEHSFTSDMNFKSSFEKMKCFRVLDENGVIVNKAYED